LNYIAILAGVAVVVIIGIARSDSDLWDDRLTSLSPVPAERIAVDNRLRQAAGPPDMRYQLFIHDPLFDRLLVKSEALDQRLAAAQADGWLDDWRSVTQVLPSAAEQQRRKQRIPGDRELRKRLAAATLDTPFKANAFEPFVRQAQATREREPLTIADFSGTPLQSWLEAHVMQVGERWISLVSLHAPEPDKLAAGLTTLGDGVVMLDTYAASLKLMRNYRHSALTTLAFAGLLIVALIGYQRRRLAEVSWVVATVSVGLLLTIAILTVLHGPLTVIHLIALLLVLGLGLDYSLFLSRAEAIDDRAATHRAVLACAVSTTVTFGILGGSSIPLLQYLGSTVAIGSGISYLIAVSATRARH
jgi:predicted exporter